MTQTTESDEIDVAKGDYVVGREHSTHEGVLFRVDKEPWRGTGGRVKVPVEAAIGDENTETVMPESDVRPVRDDDTEFRSKARTDHTNGGVQIRDDEPCPICGCNAIRWASDPLAGVGAEWCAACGYDVEAP